MSHYERWSLILSIVSAATTLCIVLVSVYSISSDHREKEKRRKSKYDLLYSLQGKHITFLVDGLMTVDGGGNWNGILKRIEESWFTVDCQGYGDHYFAVDKLVWIQNRDQRGAQ